MLVSEPVDVRRYNYVGFLYKMRATVLLSNLYQPLNT